MDNSTNYNSNSYNNSNINTSNNNNLSNISNYNYKCNLIKYKSLKEANGSGHIRSRDQ